MGLEFAAVQLDPKMLAQRFLVDLQLLGDVGLSEAESRSVLDERALVCGRLIFGGHFPLLIALLRDARAFMREVEPGVAAAISCAAIMPSSSSFVLLQFVP